MADNTQAWFLNQPGPGHAQGGVGFARGQSGIEPEASPSILWGQGTPDGDRAPFNQVNKGSLYMEVNGTDDGPHIWQKVDEGGDNADWKQLGVSYARTPIINIDNGAATTADYIILVPDKATLIVDAKFVYTEATDSAGVASANVKIGTAVGGAQIVAATAYEVSKAVGTATDLTIASGAVAADGMVAVRHTGIAATEAGEGFVQIAFI